MTTDNQKPTDWNSQLYDDKHSFVWKFGSSVIELLSPQDGETILDLGCGLGQLTSQIAESGAKVVGLDNSPAMVDEARRQLPDIQFELGDARDFDLSVQFDAVFSNAVLHWISEPNKVAGALAASLKPKGRLAVEFGGKKNVVHLIQALEGASESILGKTIHHPWYFPSIADFSLLLEQVGLEVTQAALIDRPTPLEGQDGLRNWVRMFGNHWLSKVSSELHDDYLKQVEELARPVLFREGVWFADYRRLRILAVKAHDQQS